MKYFRSFALSILLVSSTCLIAQTPWSSNKVKLPSVQLSADEGSFIYSFHEGKIVNKISTDPNAEVGIIVQLEGDPLATMLAEGIDKSSQTYLDRQLEIELTQARFIDDLQKLEETLNKSKEAHLKPASSKINNKYQIVLNGMALRSSQWMIPYIRQIQGVRRIEMDAEVKATLDYSVPLIGADSIWSIYGMTGDGIVVGILDTGIDYLHPDLGSGYGPGYKVIGGYDFFNNDSDPMDDHGHGTHVGGIVAADGISVGVAPGARLRAYKVLGADGWGDGSMILAGIELSVIDNVDIINLSLGSQGHADDILSAAVDNATAAGIVCVVAAGNRGPQYKTIDSPGAARSVITVGASDDYDSIAYFSSRGPSDIIYGIKPDLLAPGVSITAPTPQNSYSTWDGTSMATPHVAGVAALLLQYQPDLTPPQLKSRLMQSALDLGYNSFEQGAGRVRPVKAFANPGLLVMPSSLSFGVVDITADDWNSTQHITVSNVSDAAKIVVLSMNPGLPNGANIAFNPSQISLNPGESVNIEVVLNVNNLLLPFTPATQPAFEASIDISSAGFNYQMPMAFVKKPGLKVIFDEAPFSLIVFRRTDAYYFVMNSWPRQECIIDFPAPGQYDLFTNFTDFTSAVILEAVDVQGLDTIYINKPMAKNHIQMLTLNSQGDTITPTTGMDHISTWWPDGSAGWGTVGIFFDQDYFFVERNFSDFTTYNWGWNGFFANEDATENYVFGGSLNQCFDDKNYFYEPNELIDYQFNFHSLEGHDEVFVLPSLLEFIFFQEDPNIQPLSFPFSQNYLFSPHFGGPASQAFGQRVFIYDSLNFELTEQNLIYSSPTYVFQEEEPLKLVRNYYDFGYEGFVTDFVEYHPKIINPGVGPMIWNGLLWETNYSMTLPMVNELFLWQMKEVKANDFLQYRIFHQNQLFAQGNLFSDFYVYQSYNGHVNINFPSGNCVFELESPEYLVNGQTGKATMRTSFNSASPLLQGFSPGIHFFHITSDSVPVDKIETGKINEIRFALKSNSYTIGQPAPSVNLFIKHESETTWTSAPLILQGDLYYSTIPDFLPEGYYNLRLSITDIKETLEYEMIPAFFKSGQQYVTPQIFSLSGGGAYCEGVAQTAVDIVLSGSEMFIKYQLQKDGSIHGNPVNGNGQPISWLNMTAGVYTVKAFNGDQWFDMDNSVNIIEHPLPVMDCSNVITDPVNIEDVDILLTGATPSGGYYSGPGIDENNYFSPSDAGLGNHLITYYYTDTLSGCSNSCQFYILVVSISEVYINEYLMLMVYPNPAKTFFEVRFKGAYAETMAANFVVYDLFGKQKQAGRLAQDNNIINVSQFSNGIYFLKIFDDNKPLTTIKILIQH
ncbi:MAG: hypothetical protein CVT92_12135 [Bacteroidetes bacterium HGW-Bacteroidetes-1]|jgi:subtilisin family serine protease|nr:MAG: hypothetical protein CVT92_12135 [Bacteroidetes bacterium HGW-Bacteroidetes-1]